MSGAVLIIDDSLTVRADLLDALSEAGIHAIGSASAAEARAVLDRQPVELLILDVLLPDADGVELLRELRARPDMAAVPVLMLSTEAEIRDRIRGLETGSSDYIGKPYDRGYVVARVRELLDGAGTPPTARVSVLLIDDSVSFRQRFGELLQERGFDVIHASSGEEGLRSAATQRPSAVVVDGQLPGIDGSTVVRALRLDAALRHTPCVMLTGSEDHGAELRALQYGADAFVRKEEDPEMILARVTAVLRNAGAPGAPPAAASLHGPKRILAVDDSLTYLHELHETLQGEGYDVILAHSGEQALDMLSVQPVDCILLDRLMPGMDGTETCRRIKASSATRDIPLIMLTAQEDREAMIEGLSTGADDYVLKSNELDVLNARLRAQLRRKQFEDESRRVRAELMNKEIEAAQARSARALAESRAELLSALEQKNRELEQADRMKSEFLSNMSHELRTPLNAIIGFSEGLKDGLFGELAPRQKEYITEVFNSGLHLLALINEILDLSKVEAGQMALELGAFSLNELLRSCLAFVSTKAASQGVALEFIPFEGDDHVVADARKVKQIALNLLSNAVKFTEGAGRVRLSVHRVDRGAVGTGTVQGMATRLLPLPPGDCEQFAEIRVRDSGIGIDPRGLERLFQSFVQLDSSLTRQREGTGLGLALASRLAALHGGTIGVASAPQLGSEFAVWVPWHLAAFGTHSREGGPDARSCH